MRRDGELVFEVLVREHLPELLAFVRACIHNRAAADDIVQESFLRLGSASGEISNHPAYLRKVVLNQARQYLRRRGVERRHLPLPPDPLLPAELDEIWLLLEGLSSKRRVALVLRYYEDLPFVEIAQLMDCRVGTARSLVHRGLKNLRRMLDADTDWGRGASASHVGRGGSVGS